MLKYDVWWLPRLQRQQAVLRVGRVAQSNVLYLRFEESERQQTLRRLHK